MDCVLFASPVHIVTAWPIAPHKQGYNIVWEETDEEEEGGLQSFSGPTHHMVPLIKKPYLTKTHRVGPMTFNSRSFYEMT